MTAEPIRVEDHEGLTVRVYALGEIPQLDPIEQARDWLT